MSNSAFWKLLAIAAVGAVWYVGDGLHRGQPVQLPEFSRTASAQGIAVYSNNAKIFTTSADGKTVYEWTYHPRLKFIEAVEAK